MVISITLVFSTCAPVSVLVRARAPSLEAFLGGMASGTRRLVSQLASQSRVMRLRICLEPPLHAYPRTTIAWDPLAFLVPPSVKRKRRGTGISTRWPSTTPFGLALGPD